MLGNRAYVKLCQILATELKIKIYRYIYRNSNDMMVSLELFSDTNILYVYLVYILYDAQLNNHRDPPHSYEMLHRVLLEILHSLLGRIRKCSGFDTFRIQHVYCLWKNSSIFILVLERAKQVDCHSESWQICSSLPFFRCSWLIIYATEKLPLGLVSNYGFCRKYHWETSTLAASTLDVCRVQWRLTTSWSFAHFHFIFIPHENTVRSSGASQTANICIVTCFTFTFHSKECPIRKCAQLKMANQHAYLSKIGVGIKWCIFMRIYWLEQCIEIFTYPLIKLLNSNMPWGYGEISNWNMNWET